MTSGDYIAQRVMAAVETVSTTKAPVPSTASAPPRLSTNPSSNASTANKRRIQLVNNRFADTIARNYHQIVSESLQGGRKLGNRPASQLAGTIRVVTYSMPPARLA